MKKMLDFLTNEFENVAVLGPERQAAQVEISLTDARVLGVDPPVRLSGDTDNTPGVVLEGNMGKEKQYKGGICARRHIHMTPEDADRFGVSDKQVVSLQTYTRRPAVLKDVPVRVSPSFATYVHLDYDEANAIGFAPGDLGRIVV